MVSEIAAIAFTLLELASLTHSLGECGSSDRVATTHRRTPMHPASGVVSLSALVKRDIGELLLVISTSFRSRDVELAGAV
jgi:hypothetical protein